MGLWYAEFGFDVAPVNRATKKVRSELKSDNEWHWIGVTRDPDTIRAWWAKYPNDNVGIIVGGGYSPGICVVDIDGDRGGGETLKEREAVRGKLPGTVCSITKPGNYHAYYRYDQMRQLISYNGIGPGIQLMGGGGKRLLVEFPSIHRDPPHRQYRWGPGYAPWEIPIAPAPEWLYRPPGKQTQTPPAGAGNGAAAIIDRRTHAYCRKALGNARRELAACSEGERNNMLNIKALSLAHLAHYNAFTEIEARAALAAACAENGLIRDDGQQSFDATFASGWSTGLGEPKIIDLIPEATGGKRQSIASKLLKVAAQATLFRNVAQEAFADLEVNGHRETWAVQSRGFRQWLSLRYFEVYKAAPNATGVRDALSMIEAACLASVAVHEVALRFAWHGGAVYHDLCNAEWQVVEITPQGWRVLSATDKLPVRFQRTASMLALPEPVLGGSLPRLTDFLNLQPDTSNYVRAVSYLLASFWQYGERPVGVLSGGPGSAKTTGSLILRGLIDPSVAPVRRLPDKIDDLYISAKHNFMLVFDNLSGLTAEMSDALCQIASGGALAKRELWTNDTELLVQARRQVLLNGIGQACERADLLDRSLLMELKSLEAQGGYRMMEDIIPQFEATRAALLGALYDAVAAGLKMEPTASRTGLPRMADFTHWILACEAGGGLWEPGRFMEAYKLSQARAVEVAIDSDMVASAVRSFVDRERNWRGTMTELLAKLEIYVGPEKRRMPGWPRTANHLGSRISRVDRALSKIGILIERSEEGHANTRYIRLCGLHPVPKTPS
jgi:hypothetical protein